MEIVYLLIPLSIVLVFLIAVVFWYAVKSGQFDDLEGPGHRLLLDDDDSVPANSPAAVSVPVHDERRE